MCCTSPESLLHNNLVWKITVNKTERMRKLSKCILNFNILIKLGKYWMKYDHLDLWNLFLTGPYCFYWSLWKNNFQKKIQKKNKSKMGQPTSSKIQAIYTNFDIVVFKFSQCVNSPYLRRFICWGQVKNFYSLES